MLHRLYATYPLLNFWHTNFPTCTTTSDLSKLFIFVLIEG